MKMNNKKYDPHIVIVVKINYENYILSGIICHEADNLEVAENIFMKGIGYNKEREREGDIVCIMKKLDYVIPTNYHNINNIFPGYHDIVNISVASKLFQSDSKDVIQIQIDNAMSRHYQYLNKKSINKTPIIQFIKS